MYCVNCGTQIPLDAPVCPECGARAGSVKVPAGASPSKAGPAVIALKDAVAALGRLARNPVGSLAPTYEELGPARALAVGAVFAAVFAFGSALGVKALLPGWLGLGVDDFLGMLLLSLVPPVALTLTAVAARVFIGRSGTLAGDAFYAGASLLPVGLATLAVGVLSISNANVTGLLMVTGLCVCVLMLFGGTTRLTRLSEGMAVLAVPVMLLITAWVSRSIGMAVLF